VDDTFWKVVAIAALTVVASMCGLLVSIIRSLLSTLTGQTSQNTVAIAESKIRLKYLEDRERDRG
jgi:hypothetical protein